MTNEQIIKRIMTREELSIFIKGLLEKCNCNACSVDGLCTKNGNEYSIEEIEDWLVQECT